MLDCKQVATSLASGEYEGAGLRYRLAVWAHLLICKYCRAYARQMRLLGELARRLLGNGGPDPDRLARLEEQLVERCQSAPAPGDSGGDA